MAEPAVGADLSDHVYGCDVREDAARRTRGESAVYVAIGITLEGAKDVLGTWTGATEGAKFWLGLSASD